MNFSRILAYPNLPFTALAAGTGVIFGLDLSDPQTVNSLLGGGLAFVALIILWRLLTRALNHSRDGEKNEGKLLELFSVLLVDVKKSLDQSTEALRNNTMMMQSLKDSIEQGRQRTDAEISTLSTRVGNVEEVVEEVKQKVTRIDKKLEK